MPTPPKIAQERARPVARYADTIGATRSIRRPSRQVKCSAVEGLRIMKSLMHRDGMVVDQVIWRRTDKNQGDIAVRLSHPRMTQVFLLFCGTRADYFTAENRKGLDYAQP